MDLLTPIVSENLLHPNFKVLLQEQSVHRIFKGWLLGFADRDNKFVREFQETFNSSFWEVYLHAALGNLGFRADFTYSTPDFSLSKNGYEIIVEAAISNNPKSGTPEYEREIEFKRLLEEQSSEGLISMHDEIIDLATERLSNAFDSKSQKYLNKYHAYNHVGGKPFILGLGSFEQPLFYYQAQGAIQRLLYGLTKAEYQGDCPYFEYSDHIFKKSTGAKISIGLFKDETYAHISAVLFSPVATFGKLRALQAKKEKGIFIESYRYNDYGKDGTLTRLPHKKYKESLLDGLSLYLNPYATNPLNPDLFDSPDIAINYNLHESKVKHGFLYRRQVFNISGESII